MGFNRGNPMQMDSYQEMAEPEKYWTKDDFKEHVHKELNWSRIGLGGIPQDAYPISDNDWNVNWGPYHWLFWSREHDDSDPLMILLYDKIKLVLRKLLSRYCTIEMLVQFWAATTTSDGRTLLTTKDQPFALTRFSSHGLCEYRMISKDYTFYVDGRNGEEDLGIPGRVYRNKCPECTPNVGYYSVKEYPQRDRALRCGVGQSFHLPVIEQSSQICVGVLEIVGEFWLLKISDSVYTAFQRIGLECFDSCEHHKTRAWASLKKRDRVVGRALSAPNLLSCSDVTLFSMAEYPLAHFARECRLRGCFAISLRSNYTENDVYVLEIFLPPSNKDEDPLTSMTKILETMKKEFKTFRLASGEELREGLSVEVIEFQNGQKHHCVQTLQVIGSLPSLELLQNGGEIMQVDSSDHQSVDAEKCEIDVNHPQELGTKKTSGREYKNTGVRIEIPYEDILHYSGLSCSDAARNLEVSISTFRRVCRQYGISRWPPRNVDKVRPPRPSHVDHQEVPQLNSNLTSNQASASIAHTQPHDRVMQNANTVNVKAKYVRGLTVLFPLSLSSTLEELYECIETRLPLSRATYHACYIDGDNDKITITCDQDLQFWLCNSRRSPGSNAVVLHIDPISQVYHRPMPYIDCFPASLRSYIRHVKDVAVDGNCGFRAIAGLMNIGEQDGWVQVRRDLLTELNLHVDDYKTIYWSQERINELTHCLSWFDGFPGMDRWMTMPDMGHLIASYYNVVLYHLSDKQCLTFLPLWSEPIPAASRKEIAIGFVNNNHFVEVFLVTGHPVPPVARSWMRYRSQYAQGWDTTYNHRIQHFRELMNYNVAITDAISLD